LHAVLAGFAGLVVGERYGGFSILKRHNFSFAEREIADGKKGLGVHGAGGRWWGVLEPNPMKPGYELWLGFRIAIFWDPNLGSQNSE
jgi:hypothetical protein